MPRSVALLGLGPDLPDRLVADAALQTVLNRLLQGPELRVPFLVAPNQVAEVFAVIAVLAACHLGPDSQLLPISDDDALLDQRHTSLQSKIRIYTTISDDIALWRR